MLNATHCHAPTHFAVRLLTGDDARWFRCEALIEVRPWPCHFPMEVVCRVEHRMYVPRPEVTGWSQSGNLGSATVGVSLASLPPGCLNPDFMTTPIKRKPGRPQCPATSVLSFRVPATIAEQFRGLVAPSAMRPWLIAVIEREKNAASRK